MLIKKVFTSLICTITMILLCSTYSYAATIDSNMKSYLTQELTRLEESLSRDKAHFNLDDNDIISNNLELGEIYINNTIDGDNSNTSSKLSEKLKKSNYYVSTIKLKDSGKPIGLAYIKKKDSKWFIFRVSSYNSLDDEIQDYKKNVDDNPIIIIDEAKHITAIGSDRSNDTIKVLKSNSQLDLKKGQDIKVKDLKPKLEKIKATHENADDDKDGGTELVKDNVSNYGDLVVLFLVTSTIVISVIVIRRHSHSKANK